MSRSSKVSLPDRINHITWAWFTLPMSAGGVALLLSQQPHTFPGLITIGKVVFILDIAIFVALTVLISLRFCRQWGRFTASLRNAKESLFFSAFPIAIFTVLGGIQRFGVPACGPWLIDTVRVLFWIYTATTLPCTIVHYYILFSSQQITSKTVTPALVLPVFPPMLCGTLASLMAPTQSAYDRMPMIVAGTALQGFGFLISLLVNALYMVRLLDAGWPPKVLRPSMFIAVGPPAFTSLALIGMANALPEGYGYFARHPIAIEVFQPMALGVSIFIWSLSFWFFCTALICCVSCIPRLPFRLVWYAFVFPNTGFAVSIIAIGNALESPGILWAASIVSIFVVVVFLFVLYGTIRAVCRGDIVWPGKDEDA